MTPDSVSSDQVQPHSNYYQSEGPTLRHAQARSYEQQQFHTRLSAPNLAQSTEIGNTASGGGAGNIGSGGNGGGMFYPPSTFIPARMAPQQYSAAPSSSAAASSYQMQTDYIDSELSVPANAAATASAYYAGAQNQAPTSSQYSATPITIPHAHQDAPLLSASSDISAHTSTATPRSGQPTSASVLGRARGGPIDPPSPTNLAARRHTTADIGRSKTFATGPFAGRTVRAEIREVQKADLGRKCADPPTSSTSSGPRTVIGASVGGTGAEDGDGAGSRRGRDKEHADKDTPSKEKEGESKAVRKDRRPLDPPPVVELKLFESINHGTSHQYERQVPAEEVEIGGLICQVDLFRVTIPPSPTEVANLTLTAHPNAMGPAHATPVGHGQAFGGAYGHGPGPVGMSPVHPHHPAQSPYEQHSFAYPPSRRQSLLGTEEDNASSSPLDAGWESGSPVSPISPYMYHPHPPPHHAAVHPHTLPQPHPTLNTHVPTLHAVGSPSVGAPIDPDMLPPPSESDKLTRVLFGESYAHACSILDLSGKPTIYFVFADLSVKLEGLFRPRYRFFDLFSRTAETTDVPILAQCFGGAFAVYSTKEFPGLKASTPLTKHLSRWGIRVNIRETERKRRAPDGGAGNNSAAAGKDKRKGGNGKRSTRGGSVGTGASSGASVRGEDEADDRQDNASATSPVMIPRGVDAPKRYLDSATRGRGRSRTAATAGASETRGRGRRGD